MSFVSILQTVAWAGPLAAALLIGLYFGIRYVARVTVEKERQARAAEDARQTNKRMNEDVAIAKEVQARVDTAVPGANERWVREFSEKYRDKQ